MALLSERWIVLIFGFLTVYKVASLCEVSVPGRSWPEPNLLVPLNSTVKINCTQDDSLSYWSINLANDGVDSHKQFSDIGGQRSTLNSHGVYELPSVESTLRLMISDTGNNNQTEIFCFGGTNIAGALHTTLTVYDPSVLNVPVKATPSDSVLQSATISWNPPPSLVNPDVNLTYELFVISDNTEERTFQIGEHRYHVFTAPEDAPLCEVYNFSVTATYVGAIYTGAGCSVPSPVLSTMLPSLPDIEQLEDSLKYTLKKQSTSSIALCVSYKPASYCEKYPVTDYTLEVIDLMTPGPPYKYTLQHNNTSGSVDNLTGDTIYVIKVLARNAVGNVSTKGFNIYTTDVQSVKVLEVDTSGSVVSQCDFVVSSDATGCMIVLVGEVSNTTVTLTKNTQSTQNVTLRHTLPLPLSCYYKVFAFDLEGDGLMGTLPVPGVITVIPVTNDSATRTVKCSPIEKVSTITSSWIIGLAVSVSILFLLFAISICLLVFIIHKVCCKPSTTNEMYGCGIGMEPNDAYGVHHHPPHQYDSPECETGSVESHLYEDVATI